MKKIIVNILFLLVSIVSAFAQTDKPTLFRQPAISRTDIVFSYAGDLWMVARNGGGSAADYIINVMRRPLMNYWSTREGEDFTTPVGSIYGPKTMIINEYAGSGGDLMPWMFRQQKIGALVGKKTWGGLVGVYNYPTLIDGGQVTAPRVAFRNLQGELDIENKGVAPDVDVDLDPKMWRQGRDIQLEKAVEVTLAEIKRNPARKPARGAFPNYRRTQGK